jgi:hypothetical protein
MPGQIVIHAPTLESANTIRHHVTLCPRERKLTFKMSYEGAEVSYMGTEGVVSLLANYAILTASRTFSARRPTPCSTDDPPCPSPPWPPQEFRAPLGATFEIIPDQG